MEIKILQLIAGAKQAKGLTVIIDVFRAFSVACYVMENGAKEIIPSGDIDIAYRLKSKHPDFILIGERNAKIQPGFDYGNSPTQIENIDFRNKTVIQTTSAGTQGIANARNAEEIITGSFVNVDAIIKYIKLNKPNYLSLVCMGNAGLYPADEDTFCAEYIKNVLENKPNDFSKIVRKLRNGSAKRFFDPANKDYSPKRDFDLCMSLNRFNFVLKKEYYNTNLVCLRKIDVF